MLLLASKSPRRREILRNAGIPFEPRPVDVHELRSIAESPEAYVRRLAREKAEAVTAGAGDIVLGADTVVAVGGRVLEKPQDAADARRMLRLLAGRSHFVITGVCLRSPRRTLIDSERTMVRFAPLTDAEIEAYVNSGEPMDKAGGYAIQGLASKFIERIEGCYFNVVGLPVAKVYRLLKELEASGGGSEIRAGA
jgi:septum formation protein